MHVKRWVAAAAVAGLVSGCADAAPTGNAGAPQPRNTVTPSAVLTQPSSRPAGGSPATATPKAQSSKAVANPPKSSSPHPSGSKPAGKPRGQLTIKHGACRWMPNIFVDIGGHGGSDGVELDLVVRALQLDRTATATVRAVGSNGEYAQGTVRLKLGEDTGNTLTLAVKPSSPVGSSMTLTITVDPEHAFDQGGFTADDTLTLLVLIPSPPPKTASNLDCG